jgi:hypothetical protein
VPVPPVRFRTFRQTACGFAARGFSMRS